MSNIRLSKEHGLNPSMIVCFWCGEGDSIALFGSAYKDPKTGKPAEAPMRMITDYEPCQKCHEQFDKGIAVFEISHKPHLENQPSFQDAGYPTGRLAVVTEEAMSRFLKGNPLHDPVMKQRKMIVDDKVFERVFLPAVEDGGSE